MKTILFYFFLFCSLLIESSCKKNIAKEYTGNFYFFTDASSYMGEASNDSVIYFYGSVTADSKNTLKIVYGPRLMPSSNTLIEGSDVLKEKLLTPYITDINGFEIFAIADQIYDFGKISRLRKKLD